jgi:hypothetical protein
MTSIAQHSIAKKNSTIRNHNKYLSLFYVSKFARFLRVNSQAVVLLTHHCEAATAKLIPLPVLAKHGGGLGKEEEIVSA